MAPGDAMALRHRVMIIDAHAHAWRTWPYDPTVPDPATRGNADQLLYQMDVHGVDEAVLVSARIRDNADNNDYVAAQVARHPDRFHQFADLDSFWTDTYHVPGAARRLRETCDRLAIAGFTHYLRDEPDGWLVSDDGLELFEAASDLRLIVSLSAAPAWQPQIRTIAFAFPRLPILLHHLGDVVARDGLSSHGLNEVLESARCPNIFIKVSGFYYGSRTEWDFPFSDSIALVRLLHERFGARRMCWGSDFPVVTRAMTYRQALEVTRSHCPFLGEQDQVWVMGQTMRQLLSRRIVG